jgi:hypothetical protein
MEDVIRTKQIEIIDDEGRTRASLGMSNPEGAEEAMIRLSMKDKAGTTRLLIGVTEEDGVEDETPFIALADSEGKPRISMVMEVEGDPSVTLTKADGSIGLAMHVGPRSTSLNIVGTTADSGVVLHVREDNSIMLTLSDSIGKARASLLMLADGTPGLNLLDEEGQIRISVRLLEGSEPGIYLLDKDGNTTHSMPSGSTWISENGD